MSNFKLLPITLINNWQKRSLNSSQSSKLIFIGGTSAKTHSAINIPPNRISLDKAQISDWVEITRMYLDRNTHSRLHNLGLKPKVIVEIVSKTASGSVIIRVNQQHIGLGAEIARRLIVSLFNEQNNEN